MLLRKVAYYLEAMRSWSLSRPELRKHQDRELRIFLREAYEHVPFYRARFTESGLLPEHIRGVDDLQKIPALTKAEVNANFPAGITRRDIRTRIWRDSTGSGTSKVPTRVLWSEEQSDTRDALLARRLTKMGVRPWDRLASVWPPQKYWRKRMVESGEARPTTLVDEIQIASFMGGGLPFISALEVDPDDLTRTARRYDALHPDVVIGRASVLRRLGLTLGELKLDSSAKSLVCGNEFFTASVERDLRKLFHAEVFRAYGGAEFGVIGGECVGHKGIHLYEDFMIVEVLKEEARALPGEVGEIVLTSLHNRLMPFVRYRTGDFARVADAGVCPCGSSLMRVGPILGRERDAFVAKDGRKVLPLEVAESIESAVGLRDYQVIQRKADDVVLRLPRASVGDRKLVQEVASIIEGIAGTRLNFTVEERPAEEIWEKSRPVVHLIAH